MPKGVRKAIPRALNLAGRAPRIWSHRAFNFVPLALQNPLRKWHLDRVLIQKKTFESAQDLPKKQMIRGREILENGPRKQGLSRAPQDAKKMNPAGQKLC